jgi:prepilin-type N-terminal cleavage/methylation domain-containing protein
MITGSARRDPISDDGFTLLEIIVAVVVLGFVLAGLSQATRFGINAWNVQTKMTDNAADIDRLDRVLRLLVEEAAPPMAADDKPFSGQEHRMVFVTRLPDQPPARPTNTACYCGGCRTRTLSPLRPCPHPKKSSWRKMLIISIWLIGKRWAMAANGKPPGRTVLYQRL